MQCGKPAESPLAGEVCAMAVTLFAWHGTKHQLTALHFTRQYQ
jgi:hypothetical protein